MTYPESVQEWVLYISLALILGALGSGLWESVMKPLLKRMSNIVLSVMTLGMKSASNSIYKDVARRFVYKPSLILVFIIAMSMTALVGFQAAGVYNYSVDVEDVKIGPNEIDKSKNIAELQEMSSHLKRERWELDREFDAFLLFMAILGFVYFTYGYFRSSYVISAVCHFDQCISICSPYVSQQEKEILLSRFALVSRKEDFKKIMSDLSGLAKDNDIEIPVFLPF